MKLLKVLLCAAVFSCFPYLTPALAGSCEGVVFDSYCPGACIKQFTEEEFSCKREEFTKVEIGDRVYVKLKPGFVAKDFILERVYCKGNKCSKPYSSDGLIFVKLKAKGKVLFKGTIPEKELDTLLPMELSDEEVKGPATIYFDVFPNRGSKGYSVSGGDYFVIRGTVSFKVYPKR
jgi:hypothetical protein